MARPFDIVCNDIVIPKGTSATYPVRITANGIPFIPEYGDTVVFQAKLNVSDRTPIIEKKITDFTHGVYITLTPEDTAILIPPKRCHEIVLWYDIRLYLRGGETIMITPLSKLIVKEVATWLAR